LAEQKALLRRFEGMNLVNLVEELKRQKLKLNGFDIVAKDNEIYVIAQKSWGLCQTSLTMVDSP
jgi:hypothetical protein